MYVIITSMISEAPPDELLRRSPLFQSLERRVQDEVAERVIYRSFKEGDRILEAGAPGRALLVLLKGRAEIYGRDGNTRVRLAVLEAGAVFGEIAFFSPDLPRSADVVGLSAGMVAVFSSDLFAELEARNPAAATAMEKAVLAVLTDRLENTNAMLAHLMDRYRSAGPGSAFQWLRGLLGGRG